MREADAVLRWGREAQDTEYQHLRVIGAKLKEDGEQGPRRLSRPVPDLMAGSWALASRTLARASMRRSFLLNAEAEDHAEHYYAELVQAHPEWEEMPVTSDVVRGYGEFSCWADVFRRIGLDERDHRNASFAFAGMPEFVVPYEGMPETPGLDAARRPETLARPAGPPGGGRTQAPPAASPRRVHWTPDVLERLVARRPRPDARTEDRPR